MRVAVIDGQRCEAHEAKISVFDRGFTFGDSVLETIRVYRGCPFELDAHLDRLASSIEAVAMVLPCSRETLVSEIQLALEAAGESSAVVRIVITRGEGPPGLDPTAAINPRRVLTVEPLLPLPEARYRSGVRAHSVHTVRASDATHSAKLTNYLSSVLATRDARAAGADEALILGADGRIAEGTTFNVFAVSNGTLVTPPVGRGVLAGVTRRVVLELAANEGLPVALGFMTPEELADADEVFITSTLREVLAVCTIDGRDLRTVPGPWTKRLHAAYRARAGAPPPMYGS